MRNHTTSWTRRRLVTLAVAVALAAGTPVVAASNPAAAADAFAAVGPISTYIVQMADVPATGYTGNISGYKATRPAAGAKFDPSSPDAGRYRGYLRGRHDTLARQASVTKVYDYSVGFNGFSAKMTAGKAAQLARTPGVLSVSKNEIRQADTVSTPKFLGLDAREGLWSRLGGPTRAGGRDIVIGDIDSGIWPESASFAPLANPTELTGFHGSCAAAEQWTTADCNNKIVGARYYNAGMGGDAAIHAAPYVDEVASARDIGGHGSHTASTAAGDYNTDMVFDGNSLGLGSGMAPAARIAVYKALWHTGNGNASGSSADLVQAIEDAIVDGVDVINYSISGSLSSDVDPVEAAFRNAAAAGVFVAASAGNSGPGASTVAHNSPWLTTVAAGTHDRAFQATVVLGNGAFYIGAGMGAAVPSSPIILAADAGLSGSDARSARLCFSKTLDPAHPEGFLDPAKVAGKIVVCDRGASELMDKSKAVREAGGVGMILANVSPNSLTAYQHTTPTVHVSDVNGAAIKAYVSGTANPTGSLSAGKNVGGAEAPGVADFSSRGPALAGQGDVLKPDIMAPGVDVLAAVSPVGNGGRNFDF
ncbi:MAG: hypothetical protein QOG10_3920, partial [Kribbellaceae bacterium]|nr:hypothetical protein [Kribbellaceae bacterium]